MTVLSVLLGLALGPCWGQSVVEPLTAAPAAPSLPASIEAPAPSLSLDAPSFSVAPGLERGLDAVPSPQPLQSAPSLSLPRFAGEGGESQTSGRALDTEGGLDRLFTGAAPAASLPAFDDGLAAAPRPGRGRGAGFGREAVRYVVNDEGIPIFGRAAEYYKESTKLARSLQDRGVDLSESLDVMDDAYGDVWAKLTAIKALAGRKNFTGHNVHLPMTLTWVDGVIDDGNQRVAVHTHRVFFHKAPVAESEIEEGKRRVGAFIDEAVRQFEAGGRAEQQVGPLDRVVLAFDTRGYAGIKDFLKQRAKELQLEHPGRFQFAYLDDMAHVPAEKAAIRAGLAQLVREYRGHEAGVGAIIEGVIYSRYTGLRLELQTIEHYLDAGYKILQSGRELFDERGHYVTELDCVVQSPQGRIIVVEAKSARVTIPEQEALQGKIEYKLKTYQKYRALMEQAVGGPFDVVFSVDVGPNDAYQKRFESERPRLERDYGFHTDFLFLQTPRPGQH